MMGLEGNGRCREAQLYYHDFMEDPSSVPQAVAEHINGCDHCQAEVERLSGILGQVVAAGNPHRSNHSRKLVAELQSHFDHMGERVTCRQVRRYLPGLLADRVRIPTPITVHIDQCDRCAEDLDHLRSLGLTQEQLARLGELYSEPAAADPSVCRHVKLMLADTDRPSLEEAPASLVRHICSCPDCRERVHEARQDLLYRCQEKKSTQDSHAGCGRIMDTDLFDFVVPPVEDTPTDASTDNRRQVVAEHVFSCSKCLTRLQNMHRTIFGVTERAESGVATVYTPAATKAAASEKSLPAYAAYPIEVQLTGGKPKARRTRDRKHGAILFAALKRRLRGHKLRTLVPAGLVTVVMTVLIGIYVMSSGSAQALNAQQLRNMIVAQPNVHVKMIDQNGEIRSETWSCDSIGLFAQQSPSREEVVLTRAGKHLVRSDTTASGNWIEEPSRAGLTKIVESLRNIMLSPLDRVPGNAELELSASPENANDPLTEMYTVTTQVPYAGDLSIHQQRRIYLDVGKGLPRKIEYYEENMLDGSWSLRRTHEYDYPSDAMVRQQFKNFIQN
jgi:hypothetical protein